MNLVSLEVVVLYQLQLLRDASGEAEIADFDTALVVYQNVAGLDITVHQAGRMDVIQGAKQVVKYDFSVLLLETDALLHQDLLKVVFHVLHDQKQIIE